MDALFPQLAQTSCWMITEQGLVFGQLSLWSTELRFEPAPGDEIHQIRLPRANLLSATVTPIKHRLMVQSTTRLWWFSGPGVPALGRRLADLLHTDEGSFEPNEPLLTITPVRYGPVRGEAVLTDRRLRFTATGLGRLIAGMLGQPVEWDASHAGLSLHEDGTITVPEQGRWALSGTGVVALRAHLKGQPLLAWPTQWWRGWSRVRGFVVLDRETLSLRAIGSPAVEVPLRSIQALRQRGNTLELRADQLLRFSADAGGLLLRRIADVILEQPIQSLNPDRQPVLWWRRSTEALIGYLRAEGAQLTFRTRDGAVAFQQPAAEMRRSPGPPTQIRLAHGHEHLRFEPPHSGGFVDHFWKNYRPPERTQPWPSTEVERKKLLQGQRSVWVSDQRQFEMLLQPGMMLDMEDGFGVVLPVTSTLPPDGTELTLELGHPDGVYQFEATMIRSQGLPPGMRFPRNGTVIVLNHPQDMRFYNQRSAFRVAMQMPINAWRLRLDKRRNTWIPDGDRLSGHLIDLSVSGCGLHTDANVNVGEHLFLELLIAEHWLPLEAECVRAEPGWPEGTNLGLQFLNLPDRLEQMLSQTVLDQQRPDTNTDSAATDP